MSHREPEVLCRKYILSGKKGIPWLRYHASVAELFKEYDEATN